MEVGARHVTVLEWERVLRLRDGRVTELLGAGRHRHRPRREQLDAVDVRQRLMPVLGQELITADGVTVRVSGLLTWRVVDARAFVIVASGSDRLLYGAVQEAMRTAIAAATLDELLADRDRLHPQVGGPVAEQAAAIGAEVDSLRAKDLMLPGELRQAAMDVVVTRERGRAELERARAEAATLRSLANTARLLEEHPALLQLRTLQTAAQARSTVVLTPSGLPTTTGT
ncbi:slipin family protein [Actinomycetospora sp. OC33-EN08]|uniref:Slipin family protein n=1 Tax=Actinomycetospora aurantiaca TaxID=3129233 RepID=A0ABU8MHJ7_9PSEU